MPVTLTIEELRKLSELIMKVGFDELASYLELLAPCEEEIASSPSAQKGRQQAARQAG